MTKHRFDNLIIGSGLAGMFCALKAAQTGSVALVTKKDICTNNSAWAQGGISCVMAEVNDDDSFELHTQDTLTAGAGLCKESAVQQIIEGGPKYIEELIQMGVSFTLRGEVDETCPDTEKTQYNLGKEGGHSKRRILHAGDITGAELVRALSKACLEHSNIQVFQNHHAIDLITLKKLGWENNSDACLGAYVLDVDKGTVLTFEAKSTFLATGGAGKVYQYTTNPDCATGDGIAMAYRANAKIANMEFYQFHPTCLYHREKKSFLISEAVRGEGAELKVEIDGKLMPFMKNYHELGSLAPRDIVARAIDCELKKTGSPCVWLDISFESEEFLQKRFPKIFETLLELGINMSTDPIPVVPAAHYSCGGVEAKVNGETSITGLYAIGEASCTGLHGANRLASNSLLEAVVMAGESAQAAQERHQTLYSSRMEAMFNSIPDWSSGHAKNSDEQVVITHNWQELRSFMWDYVGIFRTTKRLQRAKRRIRALQNEINMYYWDFIITPDLIELRNLSCIAELIIDSALSRKESRGLHFNTDYPSLGEIKNSLIQRN